MPCQLPHEKPQPPRISSVVPRIVEPGIRAHLGARAVLVLVLAVPHVLSRTWNLSYSLSAAEISPSCSWGCQGLKECVARTV